MYMNMCPAVSCDAKRPPAPLPKLGLAQQVLQACTTPSCAGLANATIKCRIVLLLGSIRMRGTYVYWPTLLISHLLAMASTRSQARSSKQASNTHTHTEREREREREREISS
eukprot:891007-Pelagomonas_calceolata.AAC.7